jgi:signal peptidase II
LKKGNILFIIPALAVIILDQASKIIIARTIGFYQSIPIINGLVNLVHVRNRGMAFGIMNRPDAGVSFYFLVAITIAAILLILFWFTRIKQEDRKLLLGLSLILGGAIGNLIDRIRLKEVIDFVDVYFRSYHWPAFNVADSAITIGAVWIALHIIFFNGSDTGEKNAS